LLAALRLLRRWEELNTELIGGVVQVPSPVAANAVASIRRCTHRWLPTTELIFGPRRRLYHRAGDGALSAGLDSEDHQKFVQQRAATAASRFSALFFRIGDGERGPALLSRDRWRIMVDKWRKQLLPLRPPPG
jgi:hypothetical protein